MSVVSPNQTVSDPTAVDSVLADAVESARQAVVDLGEGAAGTHLGVEPAGVSAAVHRFAADLPGYGGWQWAVVVAAPPGADAVTVSEVVLLPGPDSLVAPTWIPWDQRIQPGDLSPGDLLPPPVGDPRLVPGYVATGDPEIDDVALELGFGRTSVMSREGRLDTAERWAESDYGPDSPMAKTAPSTCGKCGFYLPIAGSLKAAFGVCGNEMSADGHVVHAEYGCGAHSDTVGPTGAGSPAFDAYDDGAVETVARPAVVDVEAEPGTEAESLTEEESDPETESTL
ncbi:DUF3027 domain-containing protein [Rhodococcoides trifolii]|uniref:DUF3027 domain-containing protein n=1 Tax=Rhodococcoides trifolii TaxID=908250 RepID=UPI001E422703|nr:DUF3027 domain-containing protein [Rhodococcus trifolii]